MDSSLAAAITTVRLHAEAALLRRLNAGAGFADPRLASQIYLRDEAALSRVAGGALRPQGSHRKAAGELARQIATAAPPGPPSPEAPATPRPPTLPTPDGPAGDPPGRLATMTRRLGIDPAASGVLLVAVAYALDLDTRELCHALSPRRGPQLTLEACADILETEPAAPAALGALIRAIAPGAPLRRGRALTVEGEGLAATLDVPGPALAWLLGDDALAPPLQAVLELVPAEAELGVVLPAAALAALDAIVPRIGSPAPIAVVIRGPRGSGRRAAAHRLARALGRPLVVIPVPALLALEGRTRTPMLGQALAAARLRGAVPLVADADALYDERGEIAPEHLDAIAHVPGVLVAASSGRGGHLELRRPQLAIALPRTELADRERAWRTVLEPHGLAGEAGELAARYVIGPGAIAEVVAEAARYAGAAGGPVDREALEASVGRRLSLRLGTYGTVVHRKARFSELVLPDDVIDTLHDMIVMVRERAQILERWGYQRHLGISRGVAGLFSGEPGTGKTMAASVVASELGLELVRIDLSAVVSKYVGETEKNLAKIFDEAQDAHAMLLFDEADSLFGKRTELKTAQDRFANLEVNYILQRMESFDGVSVLTTNAESSIDPALQRRLNFRIRFPEPEPDERARLWRQLLPPQAGLHDGVDFHALAERFDMTGGYIKNAVVRAAVIAARAGRALTAEDLWAGAHHEYVEMGKVMPQLPRGTL
ncbi:MAG TPA: ATP-binding protein [Kofleriaceae bacterium]|nr:ATP-binding protein [Kofleriaceae bacterium]